MAGPLKKADELLEPADRGGLGQYLPDLPLAGAGPVTQYDFNARPWQTFESALDVGEDYNPIARLGRLTRTFAEDYRARFQGGELVDAVTARKEVAGRGLDLKIGDGGITRYELDLLQYLKQREMRAAVVSARTNTFGASAAGLAGGFLAGAVDPINIASSFIPVVGEARYAAWLARAGTSTAARVGVRVGAGAIEGAVGAALVEPISLIGARAQQTDYTGADSFLNVMFGTVLGGGLHSAGGAIYDARVSRALRSLQSGLDTLSPRDIAANAPDSTMLQALHSSVDSLIAGQAPNVNPIFNAAPNLVSTYGVSVDFKPIKDGVAFTPAGRRVPVTYAIVDLDSLTASHSTDLTQNPNYPGELQPRERTRAQSEQQVSDIATKLNPALLGEQPQAGDGAPIVAKDGTVESGNGRVIALRRVAEGNPVKWAEYQAYLNEQGYDTGGIAKPVLVRIRTGELSPAERSAFTLEANASTVAGMSAGEMANADARALTNPILELHRGGDFRSAGNVQFVRAAVAALAPSQGERAGFYRPDGSLSEDGARRIERAILARAFGDDSNLIAALTEGSEDSGIKAIGGALIDIAPEWSKMRAEAASDAISSTMDTTVSLLEAIATIKRARDSGLKLNDMLNQRDLLKGDISEVTMAWARSMFRDQKDMTSPLGREKLTSLFRFYVSEARQQTPGPRLFGENATPLQILGTWRNNVLKEGIQLDLLVKPKDTPRDVPAGERLKIYHSTPHLIDTPSLDHVGSGEGAQIQGHGLYGAEARRDSATYATSRSDTLARYTQPQDWPAVPEMAQHLVTHHNGVRNAVHALEDAIAEAHEVPPAGMKALQDNLDYLKGPGAKLEPFAGHVYAWEIDAREADLLDADKTLAGQPAHVQAAIKKVAPGLSGKTAGDKIMALVAKAKGSPAEAAAALRAEGVKGVVYSSDMMDPEGREFVIFDPKDIVSSQLDGGQKVAAAAWHDLPAGIRPAIDYLAGVPARAEGETQKVYAKREIDVLPIPGREDLPDVPALYFDTGHPETIIVEIDKVIPTKSSDDKGATVGLKRMVAARGGLLDKRDPIDVSNNGDGTYTVVDGNGTVNSAKSVGFAKIPIRVVEGDKPETFVIEGEFKKAGKEFAKSQSGWSVEQALALAGENLQRLNALARVVKDTIGDGVAWSPGPIKTEFRMLQKLEKKKSTDAGQITDVVRGTFYVISPEHANRVVAHLAERTTVLDEGWRRYPGDYIDRKLSVRFPNGQIGEIIVISANMHEVKPAGHKILERSRGLEGDALDAQVKVDNVEMSDRFFTPAAQKDDGPWDRTYFERASKLGSGGVLPKVLTKPSSLTMNAFLDADMTKSADILDHSPPVADLPSAGISSQNPARLVSSDMNTAGSPSQFKNSTDTLPGIIAPPPQDIHTSPVNINETKALEATVREADEAVKLSVADKDLETVAADVEFLDAQIDGLKARELWTPADDQAIAADLAKSKEFDRAATVYDAAAVCLAA